MNIKGIVLVCLLVASIFSKAQTSNVNGTQSRNIPIVTESDSGYSWKVIPASNHTWGYDIFKGGKRIIHQQNIPGISGIEGFMLQSDAEKVAELVTTKLNRGEMPPSVSKEELINLKVLK